MGEQWAEVIRRGASADDRTEQDYREMFEELRQGSTLRIFCARIDSAVSPTWWGQYEAGTKRLTHARKAELRQAVGLPTLPAPASEVLQAVAIAPDATIYQVGQGEAGRVVVVGATAPERLALRLNGALSYSETCEGDTTAVTPVTMAKSRVLGGARRAASKGHRPYITDEAKWTAYQAWSAAWDEEHGQ